MMQFKLAKRNGDSCYIAHDERGKEWKLYKSYATHLWHFIREDHDVSSIGYLTMGDAKQALEKAIRPLPMNGTDFHKFGEY